MRPERMLDSDKSRHKVVDRPIIDNQKIRLTISPSDIHDKDPVTHGKFLLGRVTKTKVTPQALLHLQLILHGFRSEAPAADKGSSKATTRGYACIGYLLALTTDN